MRVNPIGPVPCRIMGIGEGPGIEESETGIPFVGKSGLLLDSALFHNGIPREAMYLTNVVKERLTDKSGRDRAPTDQEISEAWPELEQEIREVDPEFILLIGGTAVKAVYSQLWLDAHHGQFFPYREFGRQEPRWALPSFHPAAGLHNPALSPHFSHDVERFCHGVKTRDLTAGIPWWHPGSWQPKSGFHRQPVVLGGRVAVDTEGTPGNVFCVSYSGVRGEGWVAKPELVLFHERLEITLHHALWDMAVLDSIGRLGYDWDIHDTMLMAYVLQVEPQALKDLVARHLGRNRPEYKDLIRPHHERKLWVVTEDAKTYYDITDEQLKGLKKRVKDLGNKKDSAGDWVELETISKELLPACEEVKDQYKWAYSAIRDREAGKTVNLENRFSANKIPIPHTDLNDVPQEEWVPYAADDATDTLLISDILNPKIDAMGLRGVYDMDRAVLPLLFEMQKNGLPVNVGSVLELKDEFDAEIQTHSRIMSDVSSQTRPELEFNPRSTADIADVLLGLGRSTKRRTRGGDTSTDDRALSLMLADIETRKGLGSRFITESDLKAERFIGALQEVRELSVYSGTHCNGILEFLRPDGNLGYKWKYTRTVSGRFSTEDFNVLNIPTRTERGKRVRKCFEAPGGWVIASADLSQIELRVAAHLSQDPAMLEAFRNDLDLHSVTTSLLFGIPLDQVKLHPAKRYAAKTINFAILYGISAQALFEQLRVAGITEFDLRACEGLILEWFRAYKGVRGYFDGVLASTRRDGYVRDMWGRIRYLPNIYLPGDDWRGRQLRAEAERHANNLVIQAGATGIIKRAMSSLWRAVLRPMLRSGVDVFIRPLLQIHDELLFLVRKGCEDLAENLVRCAMVEDGDWFSVPLKSDWATGANWGEV